VQAPKLERVGFEVVELALSFWVLGVDVAAGAKCEGGRVLEQNAFLQAMPGSLASGRSELLSIVRSGATSAASRIVGARSMFPVSCGRVGPIGTPGPRMIIGTRALSS
jgi:DNA-binding CsgD family transcriptional regulator